MNRRNILKGCVAAAATIVGWIVFHSVQQSAIGQQQQPRKVEERELRLPESVIKREVDIHILRLEEKMIADGVEIDEEQRRKLEKLRLELIVSYKDLFVSRGVVLYDP